MIWMKFKPLDNFALWILLFFQPHKGGGERKRTNKSCANGSSIFLVFKVEKALAILLTCYIYMHAILFNFLFCMAFSSTSFIVSFIYKCSFLVLNVFVGQDPFLDQPHPIAPILISIIRKLAAIFSFIVPSLFTYKSQL